MFKTLGAHLSDANRSGIDARSAGRSLHRFANPGRFLRLSGRLLPWLRRRVRVHREWIGVGPVPCAGGLAARRCRQDHVRPRPECMAGVGRLSRNGAVLLASLVWRHPLADLAAVEIGPVGAGFTAMCLISGSLWGKPMWGAWWVWDARLTSVLVLFFLYLGHMSPWSGLLMIHSGATVPGPSWPWSASSICRSSSSAWTGGTRSTNPRSITLTARPLNVHPNAAAAVHGSHWLQPGICRHRCRADCAPLSWRGVSEGCCWPALTPKVAAQVCYPDAGVTWTTSGTSLGLTLLGFSAPLVLAFGAWVRLARATAGLAAGHRSRDRQAEAVMTRKRRRLFVLLVCGVGVGSATSARACRIQGQSGLFHSPSEIAAQAPRPGRSSASAALSRKGACSA